MVELRVNGVTKARSEIAPGVNVVPGLYQISINDLVKVEANDSVEILWTGDGDAVLYTLASGVHWTGMYLGSGALTPPMCQFDGQTYEYPGSCRLYYQCPNDGPIEVASCCPGVYSPSAEACISEDEADVGALCPPKDLCS